MLTLLGLAIDLFVLAKCAGLVLLIVGLYILMKK